ncbi:MAG TPA: MBL fold metallo-hydrolase [Gemmatimonadaceae bacterium]|nr:MBL fold metallo-hydrolase [Gemmatimonadaceae bacterium]
MVAHRSSTTRRRWPRRALLALVPLTLVAVVITGVDRTLGAESWGGPRSDHFDGRRFVNQEPYHDKSLGDLLRWRLATAREGRGAWPEWIDAAAGPRPPAHVAGSVVRATLVNHATLLLQLDGVNVLTDPVWSDRVGPVSWLGPRRVRAPGLRFDDLPPIDVVVISHNHYDHMDVATLRRLVAAHRPRILAGLGNRRYLEARGVTGVEDVDWGDTAVVRGVTVTAVPLRHWSARARTDRRHTLWAGYVVTGPSGRVYFGGDTGYGGHFAEARARFGPFDLALLPIGAFAPRWFMGDNHMSPREAVRAAGELGARVVVPMHYGTFPLGSDGEGEALDSLRAALGEARGRVVIAEHGAGVEVLRDGVASPDTGSRGSRPTLRPAPPAPPRQR